MSMLVDNKHNLMRYETKGRGPAIVVLHGGGIPMDDAWMRGSTIEELRRYGTGYRIFCLSLFGCDGSDNTYHYSLSSYVNQVYTFIDKLGIAGQIILIGHGLIGGLAALSFAHGSQDVVERLVLVSTPLNQEDVISLPKRGPKDDHAAIPQIFEELGRTNAIGMFVNLDIPKVLIFGSMDPYVATKPQNGLVKVVEGAGHWPMLDAPNELARFVKEVMTARTDRTVIRVVKEAPSQHWHRRLR